VRALIQRVKEAEVRINGRVISRIGQGALILLGIREGDSEDSSQRLAEKCARLRIFDDAKGKMNLSLLDIKGEALVVSQFTLYGDTRRGLRPSFTKACEPERAKELYDKFIQELSRLCPTKQGVFGERMEVSLINDGPVTLILEIE